MAHDEFRTAAATMTHELAATRIVLDRFAATVARLKDRIATALTARGPFSKADAATDADIFDDLYYPEIAAGRH